MGSLDPHGPRCGAPAAPPLMGPETRPTYFIFISPDMPFVMKVSFCYDSFSSVGRVIWINDQEYTGIRGTGSSIDVRCSVEAQGLTSDGSAVRPPRISKSFY